MLFADSICKHSETRDTIIEWADIYNVNKKNIQSFFLFLTKIKRTAEQQQKKMSNTHYPNENLLIGKRRSNKIPHNRRCQI